MACVFKIFVVLLCCIYQLAIADNTIPKITSLHIESEIRYRFATTLVTSIVTNDADYSKEATFDVTLPNEAFISNFTLEIGGKSYVGEVKGKEEAKKQYQAAVNKGQSAGYVGTRKRHTNKFNVNINVAANDSVSFILTYQELLKRRLSIYEHKIYVDPGQIVDDLVIEVFIEEYKNITTLRVPPLRGNELLTNEVEVAVNDIATIVRPGPEIAYVLYEPSVEYQRKKSDLGISGQFVVEYDIDRDSNPGEVLVMNGYFVHYFAPTGLAPMPKNILFILDKSGSMSGSKILQLKDAMYQILKDMRPEDKFNIITFSSGIQFWKEIWMPVTDENLRAAREYVYNIRAAGGTNINEALEKGITFIKDSEDNSSERVPLVLFLTDGHPTVGVWNADKIAINVLACNNIKTPIFALAFGDNADFKSLRQIASQNNGVARKIYASSDAALQLEDFYNEISTTLLSKLTFKYLEDEIDEDTLTPIEFPNYFDGTEIIIAGKLKDENAKNLTISLSGISKQGPYERDEVMVCLIMPPRTFIDRLPFPRPFPRPTAAPKREVSEFEKIAEKLWAYLTIKKMIRDELTETNDTIRADVKAAAVALSIKYNFVTPVTSMVVTKPEDEHTSDNSTQQSVSSLEEDAAVHRPYRPSLYGGPSGRVAVSANMQGPIHAGVHHIAYLRPAMSRSRQNARIVPGMVARDPGLSFQTHVKKLYRPSGKIVTSRPVVLTTRRQQRTTTTTKRPQTTTMTTMRPQTTTMPALASPLFRVNVQGITTPVCLTMEGAKEGFYNLITDKFRDITITGHIVRPSTLMPLYLSDLNVKMKRLQLRISTNGIEKGSSNFAWNDRVTIAKKWPIVKLQKGVLTLKYSRRLIFNLKPITTKWGVALQFEVVTGRGAGRRADGLIGQLLNKKVQVKGNSKGTHGSKVLKVRRNGKNYTEATHIDSVYSCLPLGSPFGILTKPPGSYLL